MLAPRRVPPCFTASVAALKTRRNETGPEARPPVERTMSFLGRRRENAKPVPPPDWWMIAAALTESKISCIESPDGQHVAGGVLELVALARVHQRRASSGRKCPSTIMS